MLCENCVHKNVCRYKSEFENLKNDIAKTTPTWAPDHPDIPWHNGFLSNYLDEKFPIQFPYNPVTIHVHVEEILTDPAHGDYDAQRIIDFVDPETGKTVGVDACFEEVDGEWKEIGKRKWYTLRKKHGERLAAILKEKED